MAEKKRDSRETRDMSIARMKESYEKNNRTSCPSEKLREFEKLIETKIVPQVYEPERYKK